MTVPLTFAEQNHLSAGDNVNVTINGPNMTVQATKKERKRYNLAKLVANTPPEFFEPVWDDMRPEGQEIW